MTPAIYHATKDIRSRLDRVQAKFLQDAGICEAQALMQFNLAPLVARRDIAMLGLIHRTVLRKGPPHSQEHFKVAPDRSVKDPRLDIKGGLVSRSASGLVAIYNLLPGSCKRHRQVKDFQASVQGILKSRLDDGCEDWAHTLSPRIPLKRHPLRNLTKTETFDEPATANAEAALEGDFCELECEGDIHHPSCIRMLLGL